jgi:hypothetical protein
MVNTPLLEVVRLLYYWQPDEVRDLAADLLERRQAIWLDVLRTLAQQHGCSKVPNAARREDLAELRAMSDEDARSIAATWRRDVDSQVERLFNANPRGNRFYYFKNMERWAQQRGRWKNLQIGQMTEAITRAYATDRFRVMNGLRGQRYLYAGPPPVSESCVRRFAAGIVNEAYVQTHPVPSHVGCPHQWVPINPIQIQECDEMWVG